MNNNNPFNMKSLRKSSWENHKNKERKKKKKVNKKKVNIKKRLYTIKENKYNNDSDSSDVSSDGSVSTVNTDASTVKDYKKLIANSNEDFNDDEEKKRKKYKRRQYDIEEIKEHLTNYVQIPKKDWKYIPRKTHIRYFHKKEGDPEFNIEDYREEYSRGGFVHFIKSFTSQDGEKIWYIGLSMNYNYNHKEIFKIFLNRTKTIWSKPRKDMMPTENQNKLQKQIDDIYNNLKILKEKSSDRESDVKIEIEKNRSAIENLVEFIRKEQKIRRHSR